MNKIIRKILSISWEIVKVLFSLLIVGMVGAFIQKGHWVEAIEITIFILLIMFIKFIISNWVGSRIKMRSKQNTLRVENLPNEKLRNMYIWKVVIVFVSIVVLSGLFYWYEMRPSQIRRSCDEVARGKNTAHTYEQYDAYYTGCLHQMGLE